MSEFEWRAHVETGSLFHVDQVVLHLFRRNPSGEVDVRMWDGTIRRVDEGVVFPDGAGITLHRGEWEAICRAVEPQAHNGELRRLEETLAVERARVDSIIATITEDHS